MSATPAHQALILLAHGSRDALWRAPFEAIAATLQSALPDQIVALAFMELCPPTLAECLSTLPASCTHIHIAPLFLGMGAHGREDVPAQVCQAEQTYPARRFTLLTTLGEHPAMQQAIAQHLLRLVAQASPQKDATS